MFNTIHNQIQFLKKNSAFTQLASINLFFQKSVIDSSTPFSYPLRLLFLNRILPSLSLPFLKPCPYY